MRGGEWQQKRCEEKVQQADVVNERLQGDRTVWCKRDAHFAFAIGDVDIDSRLLQQQRDNVLHLGEHGQMQRSATLASEQRGDERRITTRCHCLNKTHNSMSTHTHTHRHTQTHTQAHTHTHTHTHAGIPTDTHSNSNRQQSETCFPSAQKRKRNTNGHCTTGAGGGIHHAFLLTAIRLLTLKDSKEPVWRKPERFFSFQNGGGGEREALGVCGNRQREDGRGGAHTTNGGWGGE